MLKAIIISSLFLLGIVFVFQNQELFLKEFLVNFDITIFSFQDRPITNSFLLAAAFLLGVFISLISMGFSSISKSFKINQLQKKINSMEKHTLNKEVK